MSLSKLKQQEMDTSSGNMMELRPIPNVARAKIDAAALNERRKSRKNEEPKVHMISRWKPIDDLSLLTAMDRVNDLKVAHRVCKFSCLFSLKEVHQRWQALLFSPMDSATAMSAIENLHPETAASVRARTILSPAEEQLIMTIKSTEDPTLAQFQELIDQNAAIFLRERTAHHLHLYWQDLCKYMLLPDQVIPAAEVAPYLQSFSEAEAQAFHVNVNEPIDEALEAELELQNRRNKRSIRLLENEISRMSVLVDSGRGPRELDNNTIACLCGHRVRFLMQHPEINFGRDGKEGSDWQVDVNLALEGPAEKVSRLQGTIKLRNDGLIFIANAGKREIFVQGKPLLTGHKTRLEDNMLVEICGLTFTFIINPDAINAVRTQYVKASEPLK
ncbi:microspherule protein 1-like [Drosophila guanche]|uniref:Blast:Microspherule protein 1 n=1 Tax=Drosophila guanche TaxID=7266 RepID=A0A3B0KE83_DROGU|nr:microspherule protein 1-like [Drosophila guanche]SPP84599.1 blast:Microspherule protein 1 [Drosophila guanche]